MTIEHSDGRPRWRLVGERTVPDPPPSTPTLRLLPQYDSYILGHRQRERLVPPAAKARIARDPKGRLEHVVGVSVVLVDGVVGGLWWRKVTGRHLHVTVEPTTDLTPVHLPPPRRRSRTGGRLPGRRRRHPHLGAPDAPNECRRDLPRQGKNVVPGAARRRRP